MMKLVVGLGNTGDRYKNNRHNIGFFVVDQLAITNFAGAWQRRFDSLASECRIGDEQVLLLKPQTLMNRSGQAVRKAIDFYKLPIDRLLVVCDDFNLPLGKLRFRPRGSAGGQNGLRDIIAHLGTDEYSRLRIGIGSPGGRDPADFVLADFSAAERKLVADAVIEAGRAVECWCRKDIQAAMNEFNGKESSKE